MPDNDEQKERRQRPIPRPELKPGEIPPERWVISPANDSAEYLDGPPPLYPGEPGYLETKKEPAAGDEG